MVTENSEVERPVPQSALQFVQLLHWPTQPTGHGYVLHVCVRSVLFAASQALPLCIAGVVMANTDVWLPPAHAALQLPQLLQPPLQSTGQAVGLVQFVVTL
jgi:hypothetical protein